MSRDIHNGYTCSNNDNVLIKRGKSANAVHILLKACSIGNRTDEMDPVVYLLLQLSDKFELLPRETMVPVGITALKTVMPAVSCYQVVCRVCKSEFPVNHSMLPKAM